MIWDILVAALILARPTIRVRVNVMWIAGGILGIAAVTARWGFDTHTDLWGSPLGLWYFIIASWFTLLTPIAGPGGALSLAIDLNAAHLYGYDPIGDGHMIAIVSAAMVTLSMAPLVFIGHRRDRSRLTIGGRSLTVQVSGLRPTRKSWD